MCLVLGSQPEMLPTPGPQNQWKSKSGATACSVAHRAAYTSVWQPGHLPACPIGHQKQYPGLPPTPLLPARGSR